MFRPSPGRPIKPEHWGNESPDNPPKQSPITLAEIGVDKHLAGSVSRAQQHPRLPDQDHRQQDKYQRGTDQYPREKYERGG